MVDGKRRLASDCEVSVQVFVWRSNLARLPAMIATAMGTGADLRVCEHDRPAPRSGPHGRAQRDELAATVREAMAEHGDRLSLNLAGEGLQDVAIEEVYKAARQLPDLVTTPNRIEYCVIGWHSPTITASGDVFPCCHFATDPSRTLGSLHDAGLQKIWTGRLARQYREEMRALMLAEADPALLPACTKFIHRLCMGRSDCAFNYYLARPKVYMALHEWAEGGPRSAYKRRAALQNGLRARRGKGRARAAQACRQGRQVMTSAPRQPASPGQSVNRVTTRVQSAPDPCPACRDPYPHLGRTFRQRLRDHLARRRGLPVVYEYPHTVQIVPTNACNYRCRACPKSVYPTRQPDARPGSLRAGTRTAPAPRHARRTSRVSASR